MRCYASSYCKGYSEKCHKFCDLKLKLDSVYELSNIPKRYRHEILLRPEKADLENFKQLKTWQEDVVNKVDSGESLFIYSPITGNGKAQPLTSKVLTTTGYKLMGELSMTDLVIGEDGQPHRLLGIYPQGKKQVYEITFSDGSKAQSCGEHLWTYQTTTDRARGVFRTTPLQDILNTSLQGTSGGIKHWRYSIPITKPVAFETKDLPIHPYLLGVLLGDGSFRNSSIILSNSEEDIVEKIQTILPETISLKPIRDGGYRFIGSSCKNHGEVFGINALHEHIRKLGLDTAQFHNKFIPKDYLLGDVAQRTQLLQGLVDVAGLVTNVEGIVAYTTSSPQLSEDIKYLVQSLGGTCSSTTRAPKYSYKGELGVGQPFYRLSIQLPKDIVPFSSKKHMAKYTGVRQREPYRKIVNIVSVGEQECQCIMLDSKNHLYLTDDLVVTHNTTWATKIANHYIRKTIVTSSLDSEVIYISCSKFLEELRSQYGEKDDEFQILKEKVQDCKLLIIDDLGAERPSDWAIERLYDIINHRYVEMKSTIFTSNFSPQELQNRLGNRIASRVQSFECIKLVGVDRRVTE